MPYCTNCGSKLSDETKFCFECGAPVYAAHTIRDEYRKTVYEGEVHKCPNCGEVLGSFASVCPSCGYELRGGHSSSLVKDFATRVAQMDSSEERASLIRNFPVANTKEDLFEFMILASSNLRGEFDVLVFNAWRAKFEQCYQKAKLSFGNDSDFVKLQKLYEQVGKQVNKENLAHSVNNIKTAISRFTATFPNPIFGIVVILLGVYEIIRIFKGDFIGMDIIWVALILWAVYKITNKKEKKK